MYLKYGMMKKFLLRAGVMASLVLIGTGGMVAKGATATEEMRGMEKNITGMSGEDKKTKQDSTGKRDNFWRRFYRYFSESNEVKEEKRFDFSIIGGPHFSNDTKLGIGMVASGLYRIDRSDTTISPSNVSLYGDITTTGFYLIGIRGNTIFPGAKYRVDLNLYFFSFPSQFWGIGYEAGSDNDGWVSYKRLENQVKVDALARTVGNIYVGPTVVFRNVNGRDFDDDTGLGGQDRRISSLGVGAIVEYDTRDFIPNPSRGMYARVEQQFFPGWLGNDYDFSRTTAELRGYKGVWRGCTLAGEIQAVFNYGDVPWSMMALLGGSARMRGYYEGQYRDRSMVQTQVELRQHIYNRHGVTAWVGAGNVFPKVSEWQWSHTLPSYGIGYRWEFKNRVNVRLDYGFGKGVSAFYFSINEAF